MGTLPYLLGGLFGAVGVGAQLRTPTPSSARGKSLADPRYHTVVSLGPDITAARTIEADLSTTDSSIREKFSVDRLAIIDGEMHAFVDGEWVPIPEATVLAEIDGEVVDIGLDLDSDTLEDVSSVKITPDGVEGYDERNHQFVQIDHVAFLDGRPHAAVNGKWVPLPNLKEIQRLYKDATDRNSGMAWESIYRVPERKSMVQSAWDALSGIPSSTGKAVVQLVPESWKTERQDVYNNTRASVRVGEEWARYHAHPDSFTTNTADQMNTDLNRARRGDAPLGGTLGTAAAENLPVTKPTSLWSIIPTNSSAGKAAAAIVGVYQGLYGADNSRSSEKHK